MWAPDTYEAPTPVTGFMRRREGGGVRGIVRLLDTAFAQPAAGLRTSPLGVGLSVLAALTMNAGQPGGLRQENIKPPCWRTRRSRTRGTFLIGGQRRWPGARGAKSGVLFYLVAYTFTTLACSAWWAGLGTARRAPVHRLGRPGASRAGGGAGHDAFLLSLGGVPPTAVLSQVHSSRAMENPAALRLVVLGVLNSVISIYYYLRIRRRHVLRDPLRPLAPTDSASTRVALLIHRRRRRLPGPVSGCLPRRRPATPPPPSRRPGQVAQGTILNLQLASQSFVESHCSPPAAWTILSPQ